MNIRFLQLLLGALLLASLPTSANAFMRYGGGGGMHYGGGGGMHYGGGGGMHSMPRGYPVEGHGMPSGGYGPRPIYGGPPHGETIVRHGPPVEHFGPIVREREFGGRGIAVERGGYGGGGVVVERGGYSAGDVVLGGGYAYSRFHHHEGGVRETYGGYDRPAFVSQGCGCDCCDPQASVPAVDPPVVGDTGGSNRDNVPPDWYRAQ
jgi:hypothetical protein